MDRKKGEPREIPSYREAVGRCRRNGWSIVETLQCKGGYRINYLRHLRGRSVPGTLRAA